MTGHYALSKRRAGFHWLAEALWRAGWDVTFFTASFSHLHRLKRDHRFDYGLLELSGKPIKVRDRFTSYVWFTPWHPTNRLPKVADVLLDPLFRTYGRLPIAGAETLVRDADMFIFESTAGLMLFDKFKALNPRARMVYRMSDDFRLLQAPRSMLRVEERVAPEFDLISVTSDFSFRKFRHLGNTRLHYHGIEKTAYDALSSNPYPPGPSANVLWMGVARLDYDFLLAGSQAFPNWAFHVIGPARGLPQAPNIVSYGERPFVETVPFVQHADIGLHTIRWNQGAEHLADSLKVIQFTYCRKPVVLPDFLRSRRTNVFAYAPGDAISIRSALTAARAYDGTNDPGLLRDEIPSWDELAGELAGPLSETAAE